MDTSSLIDLETIAKQLKLALPGVQRTAELLEEGNTVPFITRFRKDQTGGLDEPQVRMIERELSRAKLLAERKETILKSIESRGKLTDDLSAQISAAHVMGELEDIYLPYKPKKQSLASIARSRGLESLATAVITASAADPNIEEQAAAFVDETKGLPDVDAVIEGLKHLVAEHFGNHPKLRSRLRQHLSQNGKLVSKKIEQSDDDDDKDGLEAAGESPDGQVNAEAAAKDSEGDRGGSEVAVGGEVKDSEGDEGKNDVGEKDEASACSVASTNDSGGDESSGEDAVEGEVKDSERAEGKNDAAQKDEASACSVTSANDSESDEGKLDAAQKDKLTDDLLKANDDGDSVVDVQPTPDSSETTQPEPAATIATEEVATEATPTQVVAKEGQAESSKQRLSRQEKKKQDAKSRRDQRRETRRRRRERLVESFKDYFDFSDPIGRVPHHRILAINRGERTKVLRVKIECPDWDKVQAEAEKMVVAADHPFADFLRKCLQDAMGRLLQPSIEREVRRDLNDRAEEHAVRVFARNLRKLLLQPPLHQHRVVAIDPGFRSGCKLVALDEFGQMLGHAFINVLGKDRQKQSGRDALAKFIREHKATVIAVGNGAACRETETLVAEVLSKELKDHNIGYLIVNEAGTSVYSTSELGREELPDMDATVRSAVSIGRRSLDPLSELVKIDPASIGVGLYQHDVKAKHLRESLDDVVESCVNYVGVDVNSASPALLRYVSGLNSLTARKIYEYRQERGPFKNREQLKGVSGIGDSTYVQAAGFLKIVDGENPLDGTWIHPESYPIATRVLEAIGFGVDVLQSGSRTNGTTQTSASASSASHEAGQPASSLESVPEPTAVPTVTEPAPGGEATPATDSAPGGDSAPDTDSAPGGDAVSTDDEASRQASDVGTDVATDISTVGPDDSVADRVIAAEQIDSTAERTASAEADPKAEPESEAKSSDVQQSKSDRASRMKEFTEQLAAVDVEKLAPELNVGKLLLQDILSALARPGRDPREDLPPPIFRTGTLKLEDLKPGMELSGTVLNVVDFGAFVDIGLVDSGLIHVSRLADRFISDPHDVVSVGDILRVWVVEVDQKRRRVSLTAIKPGTEKPKPAKEHRKRKPRPGRDEGKSKKFRGGKSHKRNQHKPKAPPKPVVPITKEMEDGKEPMRTFGDLKQLFDKKKRRGSR